MPKGLSGTSYGLLETPERVGREWSTYNCTYTDIPDQFSREALRDTKYTNIYASEKGRFQTTPSTDCGPEGGPDSVKVNVPIPEGNESTYVQVLREQSGH